MRDFLRQITDRNSAATNRKPCEENTSFTQFAGAVRLVAKTSAQAACTESLFPNHLFSRFVLEVSLDKIRFTPSVTRVLSFGDRVPSIPDNVIADLRHSLAESEQHVFTDVPLQGEEVEIVDGPFQGARAIVTRILPAKQRVQVLMDVLGQSTVTERNLATVLFERHQAAEFVLANANPFPAT